jgi:hypothetical protein
LLPRNKARVREGASKHDEGGWEGDRLTGREGGRVTAAPSRKVLLQQKNIASQQINIVAEKKYYILLLKTVAIIAITAEQHCCWCSASYTTFSKPR